jgi:hypothetical protein
MVRRIVEQWQADRPSVPPDNGAVSMERLRLHDGIVRQVRYVARTVLLPSPHHIITIRLPRKLGFLYIPFKFVHDLTLPVWQVLRQALAQLERLH